MWEIIVGGITVPKSAKNVWACSFIKKVRGDVSAKSMDKICSEYKDRDSWTMIIIVYSYTGRGGGGGEGEGEEAKDASFSRGHFLQNKTVI